MRVLATCLLAFALFVGAPAMAAGGSNDPASSAGSAAPAKASSPATPPGPDSPAEARMEDELQQLRDLLVAQQKQSQEQTESLKEELKEQQQKVQQLEEQMKGQTDARTVSAAAPAALTASSSSTGIAAPAIATSAPAAVAPASSSSTAALAANVPLTISSLPGSPPPAEGPNGVPQTEVAGSAGLDRMVESVMPGVKLSGVVWLYDYQPFALPGTREDFNLYGVHLMLDRDTGRVGFHVEYRMRTDKLRPFFVSPDWAQQAYMDVHVPFGIVKAGEVYKQFGIFTDYSFYGGLTYFDGIKYDPEWGVSYEGSNKLTDRVSLDHDVQFFRNSQINGSEEGRDVVSDPDAHRENEFVARVVPRFKLTDKIYFAVGPSFERGQVTHTVGGVFLPTNDYWRTGGEATLDIGPTKLYGEVIRQNYNGPFYAYLPKVTYGTVGINTPIYHIPWLSTHINYGQGDYYTPVGDVGPYGVPRGKEQIIQPGLVFTLGKGYAIYEEYNYWLQKPTPGTAALFDRSLNTELYIAF
jgi:hypothetical protein